MDYLFLLYCNYLIAHFFLPLPLLLPPYPSSSTPSSSPSSSILSSSTPSSSLSFFLSLYFNFILFLLLILLLLLLLLPTGCQTSALHNHDHFYHLQFNLYSLFSSFLHFFLVLSCITGIYLDRITLGNKNEKSNGTKEIFNSIYLRDVINSEYHDLNFCYLFLLLLVHQVTK